MEKKAPRRIKKARKQSEVNLDAIMRKSRTFFKDAYMEQVKRMDFNSNNFREYIKSGKKLLEPEGFNKLTKLEQAVYLQRMEEVDSGEWSFERDSTFINNYRTGIEQVFGDNELAMRFINVYNHLDDDQRKLFIEDIPDLYMFYKDKRANSRRSEGIVRTIQDEQYEYIIDVVNRYEKLI